jgi:hypothetical protein
MGMGRLFEVIFSEEVFGSFGKFSKEQAVKIRE